MWQALARQALGIIGGMLVAGGYVSASDWAGVSDQLVTAGGAIAAIVAFALEYLAKRKQAAETKAVVSEAKGLADLAGVPTPPATKAVARKHGV